jgi:hypothetical protein
MSTQIASKGTTLHPGMYSNARHLVRCDNGVLWFVLGNRASDPVRLEFWFSTNNGSSWTEDTSQRISIANVAPGFSMRHATREGGGERLGVIFQNSSTQKMMIAFGVLSGPANTNFDWHSASPKNTSVKEGSAKFSRPDLEIWWNGTTWLIPTVWGAEPSPSVPGLVRMLMGRTRFVPYDSYSVDEQDLHRRNPYSSWARPSISLRHSGRRQDVNASDPAAYIGWHTGIGADDQDRGYMMRLTLTGSTWDPGQVRAVRENGTESGLTSGCFNGVRAVWCQVPANDNDNIVMNLMQPSDSSRDAIDVPSLGLGAIENLSVTWDNASHDIYILATGDSNNRPHYIVYSWGSRTFGSWNEINTDAVAPDTLSARLGSDGSRIDCVYAIITASTSFRYELVTLSNVPPSAPTWNTDAGAHSSSADLVLDWDHNDADGDAQAAYELRRTVDGGSTEWWNGSTWQGTTVQPASATTQVSLGTSWGTAGETHQFRVATYDGQAWSPFSSTLSIFAGVPSNPTITAPAAGSYTSPQVTVTWTVTDQSAYRVMLFDDVGNELYDSGWRGGSTIRVFEIPYTLTNGEDYTVELTTKNSEGLASATDDVAIFANLTPPPEPIFTLSDDPDLGAIIIEIDNGAAGIGEDDAVSNNIWRIDFDNDPDTQVLVAINVEVDGTFIDRSVASGTNYLYAVESVTAVGATFKSAYTA